MTTSQYGSSAVASLPALLLAETVLPSRQPVGGILGLVDLQVGGDEPAGSALQVEPGGTIAAGQHEQVAGVLWTLNL